MGKGIAIFLGFVTGFWGLMIKKVWAEVLGTPTISEKYQYDIEIKNLLMPARPLELKFQANLWDNYYSKEFSQRVYVYWHADKKPLPEAAQLAAKDVQDILNRVDKQYEVKWRISDQILGTRVANGEAVVRVRPLIFDMKFKSTPYPIDGFEIKQGIVPDTLYHLVWVVGGEKGYWQTVEAPSITCSDPFGGNCETGCLVGCEASCEGNPCMFSCQTGCQTSCEVSCQTCTNDALLCRYSLSCSCTNSGNGRVTVSGKACYDSQTGCKGLSSQNLSIYQASWGTTYTVSTDSAGDYSLNAPKPLGSDPIYVNWTDPQGKEHTCSTYTCNGCNNNADCPPGYICENGKCVQGISGNPELTGVSFDTAGFCNGVFGVSGKFLSSIGGGTRGKIAVGVNQKEAACTITSDNGTFDITVTGYSVAKGNNSISVTGEECPSGTCSGGCNGLLATTIRKTITCFCEYSISCSVDKNSVAAGGSVTFSGTLASTNEKDPTVVQSVEIYVDGNSEGTTFTDLWGNFSMPVTLKTAGKHTFEAKFGNATCSKSVTVTETWGVKVEYKEVVNSLLGVSETFNIHVTPPSDSQYRSFTISKQSSGLLSVTETLFQKIYKISSTSIILPQCTNYNNSCATVALKLGIKSKIYTALTNHGIRDSNIQDEVFAKIQEAAVEVFRKRVITLGVTRLFRDYALCYNKGWAPSCSSTAEYIKTTNTLGPIKESTTNSFIKTSVFSISF